ncbi:MAG: hypothetical protein WB760_16320 [Xanthobacteraceae bacterium]
MIPEPPPLTVVSVYGWPPEEIGVPVAGPLPIAGPLPMPKADSTRA